MLGLVEARYGRHRHSNCRPAKWWRQCNSRRREADSRVVAIAYLLTTLAVTSLAAQFQCAAAQDTEAVQVVQYARGSTARLHCSHTTQQRHVLRSGHWRGRWHRAFAPSAPVHASAHGTDGTTSSTAASSSTVVFSHQPVSASSSAWVAALHMNSTLRIPNLSLHHQDLYTAMIHDKSGGLLAKCMFILLLDADLPGSNRSIADRTAALVHRQQISTHTAHSQANGAAELSCWYTSPASPDTAAANSRSSAAMLDYQWWSNGGPLDSAANEGLPYQTKGNTFDLILTGTGEKIEQHFHRRSLTVFPRAGRQTFSCVSMPTSNDTTDSPEPVITYDVITGNSPSNIGSDGAIVSWQATVITVDDSGDAVNATCTGLEPRTAAHNSPGYTPTPVWVIDGVSSSGIETLPDWITLSQCLLTGEWIALGINRDGITSAVALSCRMERHSLKAGQPHCTTLLGRYLDNNLNESPGIAEAVSSEGADNGNKTSDEDGGDGGPGVHVESLQSDGIIAVVILGVALLVSVTTVITVYKRREHNIIVRRIRQRHRYTPKSMSEANISTI
ncbi:uncharacterized protein LOC135817186 [Sycon ciliatum]|uniref:uncharacterized protein LOC135817186 n=1 Tax=Sycon ciliatum TaxID=27933 RepID=UPI0031F61AEE